MADDGGLKRQQFTPCQRCGSGVMHSGAPTLYRVRVEQFVVNPSAIARAAGLEMMLGANVGLAIAMGPNEDLAKRVAERTGLVCLDCAMVMRLAELIEEMGDG